MPALPTHDVVRSRAWQVSLALVVGVLLFGFWGVVWQLVTLWTSKADYSHGLLIVPFIAYLLWTRRALFPARIAWPDWAGLPFFLVSAAVYVAAETFNVAKEWLQAFALMAAFAGVVVMFCGRWKGLSWAWPGLVFLPLAFQLPFFVEWRLNLKLRTFAIEWGNYGFQTLGMASYAEGNVIVIGETRLGVEQACSGLSMLLAFVALSAAIAFLYQSRPWVDRAILFASAVPIALACNMVRILVTGLVYHAGWTRLGDTIVHDVAGWLMMPLALAMLWLLLRTMDWLVEPVDPLSTTEALGLDRVRSPGTPAGVWVSQASTAAAPGRDSPSGS